MQIVDPDLHHQAHDSGSYPIGHHTVTQPLSQRLPPVLPLMSSSATHRCKDTHGSQLRLFVCDSAHRRSCPACCAPDPQGHGPRGGHPAHSRRFLGTLHGRSHQPHRADPDAQRARAGVLVLACRLRDQSQVAQRIAGKTRCTHLGRELCRCLCRMFVLAGVWRQPDRAHRHGDSAHDHGLGHAHAHPQRTRASGHPRGRGRLILRYLGRARPRLDDGLAAGHARQVDDAFDLGGVCCGVHHRRAAALQSPQSRPRSLPLLDLQTQRQLPDSRARNHPLAHRPGDDIGRL